VACIGRGESVGTYVRKGISELAGFGDGCRASEQRRRAWILDTAAGGWSPRLPEASPRAAASDALPASLRSAAAILKVSSSPTGQIGFPGEAGQL
jgi:hypothetical protein